MGEQVITDVLRVGDVARLPCNASGEPKPTIRWITGTAPLPEDPRYTVAEDGSLIIFDVQAVDKGDYVWSCYK